jgi:hypothetical protein
MGIRLTMDCRTCRHVDTSNLVMPCSVCTPESVLWQKREEVEESRNCVTCMYHDNALFKNPCDVCGLGYPRWESKDKADKVQAAIAKGLSMPDLDHSTQVTEQKFKWFSDVFRDTPSTEMEYSDIPEQEDSLPEQVGGDHYSRMGIQPKDYILKNKLGYAEGNVVKYVSRHDKKNGKEDILKAIQYLNFILEDQYQEDES